MGVMQYVTPINNIIYRSEKKMKWKQFFTPVQSINGHEARGLTRQSEDNDVLYLDVRQPKEYQQSHLPGAKLIPLGELDTRLDELNPDQPTVIY